MCLWCPLWSVSVLWSPSRPCLSLSPPPRPLPFAASWGPRSQSRGLPCPRAWGSPPRAAAPRPLPEPAAASVQPYHDKAHILGRGILDWHLSDLGGHDPLSLGYEGALGTEAVPPPAVSLVALEGGHVTVVTTSGALGRPLIPLTGLTQQQGSWDVWHHSMMRVTWSVMWPARAVSLYQLTPDCNSWGSGDQDTTSGGNVAAHCSQWRGQRRPGCYTLATVSPQLTRGSHCSADQSINPQPQIRWIECFMCFLCLWKMQS